MREAQEKATRPGVSSSPALGDQSPPAELEQTLRVAARFDVAKGDARSRALGCAEGVRIAAVDGHPCQADRDQLSGRFSPSRQGLPVRSALEPAPMSTGRPDEGRGAGRRRRQDGKAPPRPRDAGPPSLRCPGFPRAGPWAPFAGCAGSKPQGPAPPTMTKTSGIHPGTTGVSCPVCNIAFL